MPSKIIFSLHDGDKGESNDEIGLSVVVIQLIHVFAERDGQEIESMQNMGV